MHLSHGLQYLRYKRPMFAFVGESGYTRHPSPEPRTQRLTRRNRWRFGWGWYHYPQRALRAVETPDGRLSKRLICRFLRSGRRSSPHDSCFLANTQNFLPTAPVANAFTLWYDKFSKLKFSSSTSWFLSFSYRNPKFHFVVFAVHITFIVIFKVRFS